MPLKYQLNKDEYQALQESVQELYEANGDSYTLVVEGIPKEDTGALKRAKEHEKEARKLAEQKARELEDRLRELEDGESRKKGDVDAIEKSYQKKLQELEAKSKAETERLTNLIKRNALEAEARKLANDLSGPNADIILPHIYNRLSVEIGDDGPAVRVVDSKGNPTADSVDDLKQFFFTSDTYAPIVIGSKATGSGASGSKSGGGSHKRLADMTPTEEAQFANQFPEKYQQMLEQS